MSATNHPSRSRNSESAVPTAAQVRAARLGAGLSPKEAGALVYESARRWMRFESTRDDAIRMHAALWDLFQRKATGRDAQQMAELAGTVGDLARAVYHSDNCPDLSSGAPLVELIRDVLDVALRTRIGIACLGGRVVSLDLGNGHALLMQTKEHRTKDPHGLDGDAR